MSAVQGWDASPASSVSTSSSEALRERYVERTLEKILRYQKQPRTRPMDLVLLATLVVTLGTVFLRTGHAAPAVGGPSVSLAQVDARLDKLSAQEEQIHQQLAELKGLRSEVAALKAASAAGPLHAAPEPHLAPPPPAHVAVAAPTPSAPHLVAPTPATAAPLKPAKPPAATVAPHVGEQVHVLQPGESLWSISEKYYHDSRMLDALAHYNGISDPGRMHVGMTLKIPPVSALQSLPAPPAPSPASH